MVRRSVLRSASPGSSWRGFCLLSHAEPRGIYTLSLHDALPIFRLEAAVENERRARRVQVILALGRRRSEEHTSELQSLRHLVCRLLLEKTNAGMKAE